LAVINLIAATVAAETVIPVSDSSQLISAIGTVPDGGVIELASGTYPAPAGGFVIFNPNKTFTVRAAVQGGAYLDGGSSTNVLRYQVTSPSSRGWVAFEGLVFQNGFSAVGNRAGGVTLIGAGATFVDSVFDSNVFSSATDGGTGGGIGVNNGTEALFVRCTWTGNTSTGFGGGGVITGGSIVTIHESQFLLNRTNVPNHRSNALGGALTMVGGTLHITNSRFEGNEAGFTGGAIHSKGYWTDTDSELVVTNCTFVDNRAQPYPGVATDSPPSGGAITVEDNMTLTIHNSRFLTNTAQHGGAIEVYRVPVEIRGSIFRGNSADSVGGNDGRGGAIHAVSSDTLADGINNRRHASLAISDSLFQGRYQTVGATAMAGGAIFVAGDLNRMYGLGGVSQQGTLSENRAQMEITDSVFYDCDVDEFLSGGTFGGGIYGQLVDFSANSSLFMDCDGLGSFGNGGAAAFFKESHVGFTGTTFAINTAVSRGGALYIGGSTAALTSCTFIKNDVVPGVSEPENESQGAAVYTTAEVTDGLNADGLIQDSYFCSDTGISVYDNDWNDTVGYINETLYNGNTFFNTTFGGRIYIDRAMGGTGYTPAGLNDLVVDRGGGNTTDKSPLNNNSQAGVEPILGVLVVVPPEIINQTAAGDSSSVTESFLGYAWCGGSATLDGQSVTGNRGLSTSTVGQHILQVGQQGFTENVGQGPSPTATLTATPYAIFGGEQTTIDWVLNSGTFIDSVIDWGLGAVGTASGSQILTPPDSRTYRFHALTEEGGAYSTVRVYVDEDPIDLIFRDDFETSTTSRWSIVVGE
jgi:predicted outer membrane repeat protein